MRHSEAQLADAQQAAHIGSWELDSIADAMDILIIDPRCAGGISLNAACLARLARGIDELRAHCAF